MSGVGDPEAHPDLLSPQRSIGKRLLKTSLVMRFVGDFWRGRFMWTSVPRCLLTTRRHRAAAWLGKLWRLHTLQGDVGRQWETHRARHRRFAYPQMGRGCTYPIVMAAFTYAAAYPSASASGALALSRPGGVATLGGAPGIAGRW